jgi:Tol biopolymer transport system component
MEELMALPAAALQPGSGRFESPFQRYSWKVTVTPLSGERKRLVELVVEVSAPCGQSYLLRTHRRGRTNRLWFATNADDGKLSRLRSVLEDGTEIKDVQTGSTNCNDLQPSLSPDGKLVAFLSDRLKSRQIFLMPADGSAKPTPLTEHPIGVQDLSWSPRGDKIAYTAYKDGFSQIYVLDVTSKKSSLVSHAGRHEGSASWSPDGERLVFTTTDSAAGGTCVSVMDADGANRKTVADQPGWNTSASFSPSGRQIVLMSNSSGDAEIFLLDLDGSLELRQLTDCPGYDNSPRFSPDGKRIVFTTDRRGFTELYLMDADGENQRPLMEKVSLPGPQLFEKDPCWEPGSMAQLN